MELEMISSEGVGLQVQFKWSINADICLNLVKQQQSHRYAHFRNNCAFSC